MYTNDPKTIARNLLKRPPYSSYSGNLPLWDTWGLYPLKHRDSGLMAESNADAILARFESVPEDQWEVVTFSCFLHGWRDHLAIKVVDSPADIETGAFTDVFWTLFDIINEIARYPLLDDEDHSRRESEATTENIKNELGMISRKLNVDIAPDRVWLIEQWFNVHNQVAIEPCDDAGGCPSQDELFECLLALGWVDIPDILNPTMQTPPASRIIR